MGNSSCVAPLDHAHVWHPFTQMQEYVAQPPLVVVSGQGGWLTDIEGHTYLDGNASIWTNVHGHNDPDLNAALQRQLSRVAHSTMLGLAHGPGAELASELSSLAPKELTRTFFSDNGSGAVEIALKMSFQYWQLLDHYEKREVISLAGGYHGDTFGTMAVGDSGFFHDRFRSWCFSSTHFPAPRCRESAGIVHEADATASLGALRALLEQKSAQTACLILEPSVQGAAGMRLQPSGFVRAVANLCREYNIHLILDEVFVAFGRVGPMLVCEGEAVSPDFLCLAKGLTGGYLPLAATLVREEIYDAFLGDYASQRAFFHGHTFTGNPLAAAVALENIRKLRPLLENNTLTNRSHHFGEVLEKTFMNRPFVSGLRQRGHAAAIDIVQLNGFPFPTQFRVGLQVCLRARMHGLLLRPLGDSLLLVPPLCLTNEELSMLVERTHRALIDVVPTLSSV